MPRAPDNRIEDRRGLTGFDRWLVDMGVSWDQGSSGIANGAHKTYTDILDLLGVKVDTSRVDPWTGKRGRIPINEPADFYSDDKLLKWFTEHSLKDGYTREESSQWAKDELDYYRKQARKRGR